MAERKYYNANIVYQTDTFGAWVDLTNQLVHDALTINLTAQQNSSGGITTGNVVITSNLYNFDSNTYTTTTGGHLQANVIIANTSLRGGNMTSSGLLSIGSNTAFHTDQITVTANSSEEKITTTGDQFEIRTTSLLVNNATVRISANLQVNSSSANVTIEATNTHISGTGLDINSTTVDMDGTALTADYNDITFTANDQSFKANSTVTAIDINNDGTSTSTTVAGNTFIVDTDESNFNANVTLGSDTNDTLSVNSLVDTNVVPSANGTKVLGSTTLRWDLYADDATIDDLTVDDTLTVNGQTDLNGDVNLGNANTDTVSFVGEVDTNIVPSANGTKTLGTTVDRWDLFADDVTVEDVAVENKITVGNATVNAVITSAGNIDTDGTLTVLKGTTLSNTISVAGNALFTGSKVTVGNATVNAVIYSNGAIDTDGKVTIGGDITASSDVDITGEANTNTLVVRTTSTLTGDVTASADIDVSGEANVNTIRVRSTSAFEGDVTVGNSSVSVVIDEDQGDLTATGNVSAAHISASGDVDITGEANAATAAITTKVDVGSNVTINTTAFKVGNASVNTVITKSAIDTDGTLTVAGNTSLSSGKLLVNSSAVTAVANVVVKDTGANVADPATQPTLIVWGDFEVKGQSILASDQALSLNTSTISSLTVTSNTELRGTIATINATSFIVDSAVGNSTVGFVPSGNGVVLGSSTKRWDTYSTSVSATGDINTASTTEANSSAGSIRTAGGISAAKKLDINGAATLRSTLSVTGSTTVTSTLQANATVGAIRTSGGLSVAKDIYVGGNISDGTNSLKIYYANGDVAWPA